MARSVSEEGMPKALAEIERELAAFEEKLKTGEADRKTIKQMDQKLKERAKMYLSGLQPLRAAVAKIRGQRMTMATTKEWQDKFRRLDTDVQEQLYASVARHVHELALQLNLVEEKKEEKKEEDTQQ